MRPPPFQLVGNPVSTDTIDCLRKLLAEAEAGEVIGFVCASMHKRRAYHVTVCGEAHLSPTFARGMVRAIDDHLADLIRARR